MKSRFFFFLALTLFIPYAAFAACGKCQCNSKKEKAVVIEKPQMLLMGIECRTSNGSETGLYDIPKHWEKFYQENIFDQIPHKVSNEIVALYCDYEGDYTQPYSLVIGAFVSSVDTIPEGMTVKTIPETSYEVFQAKGEHPQALIETWEKIWKKNDLKRTYSGDFEVYGEKFFHQTPQEVAIYIAIEK